MATSRPRGARPSPRHKAFAAPAHKARIGIPESFGVVPSELSYWGNQTYGDCVSAEEAAAKAVYSLMGGGGTELFISEQEVINWAQTHLFLNGADLTSVMEQMASTGMVGSDGATYTDGPYESVNWTDDATLSSAIYTGPVKIGVASSQLDNVVGTTNGWFATGFTEDQNEDHCVNLIGFGTLAELAAMLGVQVPSGADGTARGYLSFCWDTLGIFDAPSMIAITGEAWLRTPTTPQAPIPVPGPTPTPTPPGPTPTPTPPAPTPTPTPPPPTPTPSPTMVYFGLDVANKVIQFPAGWSARPGVYPHQAAIHIAGSFVALPAGYKGVQGP